MTTPENRSHVLFSIHLEILMRSRFPGDPG
jgi:hypothetical protein